jgi:hypothetical protein
MNKLQEAIQIGRRERELEAARQRKAEEEKESFRKVHDDAAYQRALTRITEAGGHLIYGAIAQAVKDNKTEVVFFDEDPQFAKAINDTCEGVQARHSTYENNDIDMGRYESQQVTITWSV